MARQKKELKGWQYSFGEEGSEEPLTPSRRSRRGKTPISQELTLKRDADDMEIKAGDTIRVQLKGLKTVEVAMVKEIRFGSFNFIEVIVFWFVKVQDVITTQLPASYLEAALNPNELFITSYADEIQLSEVVDKVNVLSYEEFNHDIVLDDSNSSSTFLTRRASSFQGDIFSEEFDFRQLLQLFTKDPNEFVEYIRTATVPAQYKASTSPKKPVKEKTTVQRKKLPRKKLYHSDDEDVEVKEEANEDDEDEEEVEPEELEEPEDDELEELEDEPVSKKRKYTPRKSRVVAEDPQGSSIDYMTSTLSSMKRGFKIKTDYKPSLSSISPKKKKGPSTEVEANVFKEVKAKLHTSAKISSLPGREEESSQIMAKLATAIETETGCCIYVSGTPGVGKTATVREVITQLQELSESGDFKPFDFLEINGMKLLSPNTSYEVLWEKICGYKVSASIAAIMLEKYFSEDSKKVLVVLMDELDQIVTKKQNVMYNFFNWPTYPNSKLIVIAVANTMDLPERVLSNKISSRLGLNRIQFIGYTHDQLGDIIKHRLEMLTKQHRLKVAMHPDAIGFASRKVASVSGDARRALTICRRAVEIAEKEFLAGEGGDECQVLITHISRAINETINSPTAQFLASLPFASKLILQAILLRTKRSGLAENTLGDIIDEMKNTLQLLTSNSRALAEVDEKVGFVDFLYGNSVFERQPKVHIRTLYFKTLVNELAENGIIIQQNVPGERHRLINLNVSEEEISNVLRRDKELAIK